MGILIFKNLRILHFKQNIKLNLWILCESNRKIFIIL